MHYKIISDYILVAVDWPRVYFVTMYDNDLHFKTNAAHLKSWLDVLKRTQNGNNTFKIYNVSLTCYDIHVRNWIEDRIPSRPESALILSQILQEFNGYA